MFPQSLNSTTIHNQTEFRCSDHCVEDIYWLKKVLKKKNLKKKILGNFFRTTRYCMEFQSRVVTWSPGIVWIFNVWWSKKKLYQIFIGLIRLVKPLGNDIPCIALVMVRIMVFRAIILKRGYAWSALMICFDSELFPQNFVWQLNNDQKSLEPHRNCQIKSSKWLYFSFHMSQRIDNIQFYSYESIFLTNFKCSKHFALKKSSELWHSSSSRKGRLRIAAFQYYNSKDYGYNCI